MYLIEIDKPNFERHEHGFLVFISNSSDQTMNVFLVEPNKFDIERHLHVLYINHAL